MAVDHNNPQSRNEEILIATIDGNEYNKAPQSRMEELLLELKETIEEGGGGGGTGDYESLSNQPQINGETLIGDKTGADLGLVDAEEGKGLSTNDYDDNEKAAVAAATSAISAMKDGTDLDSFGDVEVALLDKADTADLGTAAAKDSTNAVTAGSTDLVESGAVKDAIDVAVAAAYHHAGTKTVAQLTHDLLVAANEGNVYNITDSGTTTSDFIEGIGKTIDEGSNVGICKVGNTYMFDLLSGFVDTTNFVQKSVTAGLLKNDGTVNDEIEGDVATLKSGLINVADAIGWDNHKNLIPMTVNGIKAFVTGWNGNSLTSAGITFTILTDEHEHVIGIRVNGTSTYPVNLSIYEYTNADILSLNGFILNGNTIGSDVSLQIVPSDFATYIAKDDGNGSVISYSGDKVASVRISITAGKTVDGVILPMVSKEGGVFEPYHPIIGPAVEDMESRIEAVERAAPELIWEGNFASTDGNSITIDALASATVLLIVNQDGVVMIGSSSYGGTTVLTYQATTMTSYAYAYYVTNDGKTLYVNADMKGCYNSKGEAKAITKIYKLI